ncbi:MAG: phytanoyl-CoA dioxygenase, partial [Alphaproteobacteria bacterium]
MGKGLTDAQIDAFRRDGVVFPVRLYPQTEAAQFRSALEAIEASRAGRLPPALNAKPHLLIPW